MTTYGITESGFTLKRLADILTDINTQLATVQDPVSGEYLTPNNLDENDPLVLIVNSIADSLSVLWEQTQLAYNQFDPLKATGAGLSGLVQLNNLRRLTGIPATASFDIVGTANKAILAGVQIGDMNDTIVFTLPAFVLDSDGEATVTGTCTVNGDNVFLTGALIKILTPTAGLTSAINVTPSYGGSDDESDADLRARQQLSISGTSKSVIDAVYGVLAGIQGVTDVKVYQNNTLVTDDRDIPGKSIAVVITGGEDADISAALFSCVALGVEMYGTTETTQIDTQGISYPVLFSRPTPVPIFVSMEIQILDIVNWPTDGDDNIKNYILAWALLGASGVGITEGYDQSGYGTGIPVYASELYTPVNKQQGIRIISIKTGISESPSTDLVDIEWNEIAQFSVENIEVTHYSSS